MTLISPADSWTLWAVILGGVAVSIYLEQTFKWAAKLSGPVIALMVAMVLSNLKVMPTDAPAYGVIWTYLVPTAIPLLLFRANLFQIARTAGSMFVVFHISCLGTMLGAIIAVLLLGSVMESPEKLAALMTGSYTGGSVNFFAVKESYQVSENLSNPLLVADNFIMAGFFILLLTLAGSKFMRRHYPHPHSLEGDTAQAQALAAQHWRRKEISLLDIAKALAIAFAIAAAAQGLAKLCRHTLPPGIVLSVAGNLYVLITALSVAFATLCSKTAQGVRGTDELGCYLLYVFLFAIGLPADLLQVLTKVPLMFLFCLIIGLGNLLCTLLLGKIFKLNLEELLLCVNASLGGAPTAAAMAISKGWSRLVLPGVLVGVWGYVIGTFLGLVIGESLLRWR